MTRAPSILIAPNMEKKGGDLGGKSLSLSEAYQDALIEADAIPFVLAAGRSREAISECVRQADGVLLTGGEDVQPRLYSRRLSPRLRRRVRVTPDGGERDLRELILIDETFRQRKPLLAICRGHQLLNVALGGTLLADIPTQLPQAANHCRLDRPNQIVHEVRLTPDSILAKIVGRSTLGVNSTHHQAVACVATLLHVTAVSTDGVIEGLELRPEAARCLPFLLSVQFHPERLVDRHPEHRAIFRAFTQACRVEA